MRFALLTRLALFALLPVGCDAGTGDPIGDDVGECDGNVVHNTICQDTCWDEEIDCDQAEVKSTCQVDEDGYEARCVPVVAAPASQR